MQETWNFTLSPGKLKRDPRPEPLAWRGFVGGCEKLWGGKNTTRNCLIQETDVSQRRIYGQSHTWWGVNKVRMHVLSTAACWTGTGNMWAATRKVAESWCADMRWHVTATWQPHRCQKQSGIYTTGTRLCNNKDPYCTVSTSWLLTFITMGCPPCILQTVRTCGDPLCVCRLNICSVWRRGEGTSTEHVCVLTGWTFLSTVGIWLAFMPDAWQIKAVFLPPDVGFK